MGNALILFINTLKCIEVNFNKYFQLLFEY